jgi:hypothetical protein
MKEPKKENKKEVVEATSTEPVVEEQQTEPVAETETTMESTDENKEEAATETESEKEEMIPEAEAESEDKTSTDTEEKPAEEEKNETEEEVELKEPKKENIIDPDKIYQNVEIGGQYVRVGDEIIINAFPYTKNPLTLISNEEVMCRDGSRYPINILTNHSFRVITEQTQPPKFKHSGVMRLKPSSSVIFGGKIPDNGPIQFIN